MDKAENKFSNEFLTNLLLGNRRECSAIAHRFLNENNSVNDLYENVIKVALYEVGKLWEHNQITVAAEHLATAITEGILNELFEQIISGKRVDKKVVLTCVENEKHQVGIKMVADVFEMNGWESFFLGTGIPDEELVRYLHEIRPDILALSMSMYFNYPNLEKTIKLLRARFPELFIIVGGQAFNHLSGEDLQKKYQTLLFTDLYLLDQFVKSMN
ncbi:MAG: cobalamin-dependent protein [Prolixibacteraceae bacterium]|nr:cobalamin-dependent protein [Prolixibacteraceae bacterium]